MTFEERQALYETYINTPVDYGQGPRSPINGRYKKTFIEFEPDHQGGGFLGKIPQEELFFASDHHFGHANIIKYASRPFKDVREMNETMVERHNEVVGPNDVTVMGGDIGFAPAMVVNEYLRRMNGYKIFILGNHDFERDGTVKSYDVQERWLHWDVQGIQEEFELIFTHYPLDGFPKHVVNLHGHIHEKTSPNPQHINLCVEHTDYAPVPLTKVLEMAKLAFIDTQG